MSALKKKRSLLLDNLLIKFSLLVFVYHHFEKKLISPFHPKRPILAPKMIVYFNYLIDILTL